MACDGILPWFGSIRHWQQYELAETHMEPETHSHVLFLVVAGWMEL